MSSKVRLIVGVIVVAAIAGVGAFLLLRPDAANQQTASTPTENTDVAPAVDEAAQSPEAAKPEAVAEEKSESKPEAAAFPSATERRERTGRGRIYGKASIPADGPQGLEISIALHKVPAYEVADFNYDDTLVASTVAASGSGEYEFKNVQFGTYVLLATATGYTMNGSGQVSVERPEDETNLNLVPGAEIVGRVINDKGEPVPGAHVFVGGWNIQGQKAFADRNRSLASQVVTDGNGAFATVNLRKSLNNEPGYQLAVKADGYATFLSDYIRAGTQGVEFVLKPGGIVSGMLVQLSDGKPVPDKTVALASELAVEKITAKTDGEGFFFLSDVPPGKHTASLKDDELVLVPETASFQVADGAPTDEIVLQVVAGGRISGRVYDTGSGDGIAEVTLYAYPTENQNARRRDVKSKADGSYVFSGLTTGSYRVEFRKPAGYPDARYEDPNRERIVTANVGKESGGVDFALSRGLTISGRVVDEEGKPVADASVNGNAAQGNAYDYQNTQTDGTFTLAGYSSGQQININASKQGYAMAASKKPESRIIKIEESSITGIELVLGAESTVSGTVVDGAGRPKAGIEVYAIRTGRSNGENLASATSAADGSVKFDGMSTGEYGFIFPEGGGWSTSEVQNAQKITLAKAEHITGVKIVYKSQNEGGLTISGRVLDSKGNGVARADIRLQGPWREITADATGNYTIGGLTAGSYTITAASYAYSGVDTKQAEAGAKNVNFTLKGLATVSGRVVSAATNQPVTAFRVRATGRTGQQYYVRDEFQSIRDADGQFKLSEVEDGSTTIEVRAENFSDAKQTIPAVTEGENRNDVVIRLEEGAILAGRVIDGSGKGVGGAQIFIGAVPQQWQMERQRRGVSSADGTFKLTSLPAGQSDISVSHTKFASKTVSVNLTPRIENKVDIVMSTGGTVEGRITENGKTPLAGQYVYVQVNNDHRQTQSDSNGRYSLAGLPDGKFHVSSNYQSGASNRSQSSTVNVKDGFVSEVNFDFRPGSSVVEGTIYTQPGVTISGESWVSGQVQTATGTMESYGTQTQSDGTYRLEGVVAGTLMIQVHGNNLSKRVTLDIAENTRTKKDILLYGGGTVRVSVTGETGDVQRTVVALLNGSVTIREITPQSIEEIFRDVVGQAGLVNGEAVITAVDPGHYTAIAISLDRAATNDGDPYRGAKWGTAEVDVQDSKEASVRIGL